jgi:hypothetical protein
VVTHGFTPALLVHVGQQRSSSSHAHGDGLANLQKDMGRVMHGLGQRLTVATQIVVGAVTALEKRKRSQMVEAWFKLKQCIGLYIAVRRAYLVADAVDVIVASIANDTVLESLVDPDVNLSGVGNGNEGVALVVSLGQRKASLAKVVVGALEALVSHTNNGVQADVAGGCMDEACRSASKTGGGVVVLFRVLREGVDWAEGVVRVLDRGQPVAALAQVVVVTVGALPADAPDGVQAQVAVDVLVDD